MPLISVIVPVYNVEKHLKRCINSILSQTQADFELILIDDGSTDKSGVICDEFATLDKRIQVFHKENGGVSSTRNIGLKHATGRWISFVDSDDWIEKDYLATLLEGKDTDISIVSFHLEGNDEQYDQDFPSGVFYNENIGEFLTNYGYYTQLLAPWCKLFQASIIQENNIQFNPQFQTAEDTIFVLEYLSYVKSIYSNQKPSYHYVISGTGLSCNLTNNHNSYKDIVCELHTRLTVLREHYSFNEKFLFHKLIQGRIFQELDYIYYESRFKEQQLLLKSLLHNPFIKEFFRAQRETEFFGIRWKILIFLCKHNLNFLLLLYINTLKLVHKKIL